MVNFYFCKNNKCFKTEGMFLFVNKKLTQTVKIFESTRIHSLTMTMGTVFHYISRIQRSTCPVITTIAIVRFTFSPGGRIAFNFSWNISRSFRTPWATSLLLIQHISAPSDNEDQALWPFNYTSLSNMALVVVPKS